MVMGHGLEKLSGQRTGEGQCSFHSQRAVPKNVQIIIQFFSFRMLIRLCSKSFKLGFNNMWTENFQMYRLSLEKAEEQEIKLATPAGSQIKARKFPKNVLHWLLESLCEDHNKLWKILQEMGIPDHLRNLYAGQEATVRTLHGTID